MVDFSSVVLNDSYAGDVRCVDSRNSTSVVVVEDAGDDSSQSLSGDLGTSGDLADCGW
jgi:hypothetical protein